VERSALAADLKRIDPSTIHTTMTDAQKAEYLRAVLEIIGSRGLTLISPDILFEAADVALAREVSPSQARVGILPGTMNPIHYGHIVVALGAILEHNLNLVLLAPGGALPDKPHSAGFASRNEMLTIAAQSQDLCSWLHATPIRQQMADAVGTDRRTLRAAGVDETTRRYNTDIAAFIWLFRANPNIEWTYLVGSDKIAAYGRKGEYSLVVDTLGRANTQIAYYTRHGKDIDIARDIAPYPWLHQKWQAGFFKESALPTCDISSYEIRRAIAEGRDQVDRISLTKCLPQNVVNYISSHETLLASYVREIAAGEKMP
jgi:nicotinic acid mononucleotide adenylyltransferase